MKISVIIPVYNTSPHHLMEAFMSIYQQTLKPDEVILIDDGSPNPATLDSLKILEHYYGAKIVTLSHNQGTSAALNAGHHAARNEWIAIMGSDDISLPRRLEVQANFINAHPYADVVGTGIFTFLDADPFRKIGFKKHHPEAITVLKESGWVVNHGTVMYRKSVVTSSRIGGYDVKWRRGQDVELWKRIFSAGYHIMNVHEILYAYRRFK